MDPSRTTPSRQGVFGMFSYKKTNNSLVLTNHISVQTAAGYSGYSMQYLRRLLRSCKLGGIKIGQVWLIDKRTLDLYIKQAQYSIDQRFGPK